MFRKWALHKYVHYGAENTHSTAGAYPLNVAENKILVTGSSGFIGRRLCAEIIKRGYQVTAAIRTPNFEQSQFNPIIVGQIGEHTDWKEALNGITCVIHLAARAHVMRDHANDPMAEFRRVNVAGTEQLARSAAASGVKRLVYVSSIGVNGLQTDSRKAFSESDTPNPHNMYALSKWEAEQGLLQISRETGLEIVIVRPPLVYGGNAPGNFAKMMNVLVRGMILPLASVQNLRSLIYLDNLVDALILCVAHPDANGQTYLVSDGEDISTPELLRRLGAAMGHPTHLLPCPQVLLKLAGRLFVKSDQIQRLLGSLQVDSSKIRRELNWRPPYTLDQGLRATANWYRSSCLR
jgi:nucleoside-diphosphate-sugar epimerase